MSETKHEQAPHYDLDDVVEFIRSTDFIDSLVFVSQQFVPSKLKAAYKQIDSAFTEQLLHYNIPAAYQLLCDRFELDGHRLDGSQYFTGDELGHSALAQCIEFAGYWHIEDPRIPDMRQSHAELEFIAAYESDL